MTNHLNAQHGKFIEVRDRSDDMSIPGLGVSSYSYWHFLPEKFPIEKVIEKASELGLAGVEVIFYQLESEDPSYLRSLRRKAFQNGINLYNVAIHQDFVWDSAEEREKQIAYTKHCIDRTVELGAPSIRINSGGWKRTDSFGDLVETKGWSTPWEGATEDEGFAWATDALGTCTAYAQERGITLLLENHWGLTTYADGMVRLLEGVNSPWLRAILDMGNFYFDGDMYSAMEKVAPWVDVAHAKTYPGGGTTFTIDIDYTRVFRILKAAGFKGYTTIEMEGHENAETAVPKSITLLEDAYSRV
jgi:L-ribulose-5-phosphate 3-epimerase